MADDDYANVSSESSMGNYHSRDWGFLKFSDCWRENHGSSVCVRESVVISFSSFSELEALRLWPWWCLPNKGLCMFCFCFFSLCRITPVAQEAEWWIFNLLLLCCKVLYFILQKNIFVQLFHLLDTLEIVTGPAHHLSSSWVRFVFYPHATVNDNWMQGWIWSTWRQTHAEYWYSLSH